MGVGGGREDKKDGPAGTKGNRTRAHCADIIVSQAIH